MKEQKFSLILRYEAHSEKLHYHRELLLPDAEKDLPIWETLRLRLLEDHRQNQPDFFKE